MPEKASPAPITLPSKFAEAFEQEDARYFVLRVERKLDWRNVLSGAKVKLGASPKLSLSEAAQAIDGSQDLGVMLDEAREPYQVFPLRPRNQGQHKLIISGRPAMVIKIFTDILKGEAPAVGSKTEEFEGQVLKLKPMEPESNCSKPILAYWQAGPIWTKDAMANLRFKSEVDLHRNRMIIRAKYTDAEDLDFWGTILKQGKRDMSTVYLLGVQHPGKKVLHVAEADLFIVRHLENLEAEKAPTKQTYEEYKAERMDTIDAYGAAKKRKLMATAQERVIDETKVADLDSCLVMMRDQALRDVEVSVSDANMVIMRNICPPFDIAAQEPHQIYATGLMDAVAPSDVTENEPNVQNETMVDLLRMDPEKVLNMKKTRLEESCGSRSAMGIVLGRASEGLRETNLEEAKMVARRFGVLNCMVRIYSARKKAGGGNWRRELMAEVSQLSQESRLLRHFHDTFFGGGKTKFGGRLNEGKLLCHLIIWSLYLTLKLSLDFRPIYEELKLDFTEMTKFLRYVGCHVDRQMHDASTGSVGIAVLKGTLKAPLRVSKEDSKVFVRSKKKRT